MARQLFGTDGIRGIAGEYPLDRKTACAFGIALGHWARSRSNDPEVVVGMDTRESGPWLAEHVAGGLALHNVPVHFAGLMTTPGVAYLARTGHFVAGLMISASHNPYRDNGLKLFDRSGYKLPDLEEEKLEQGIFAALERGVEPAPVCLEVEGALDEEYLGYLISTTDIDLRGKRLLIDCANGAATHLGPELFRRLRAEVQLFGCEPNGKNINDGCGALHTGSLAEAVKTSRADAGLAFDGDADRAILVAPSGRVVDGDSVLLIVADWLKREGKLDRDLVVATVMSNLGLERALKSRSIALERTPVGDKYVLEEMLRRGAAIGGEQSGHVIFRQYATTGDGLLTALRVLEIMQKTGKTLDELTADLEIYPQLLVNVRVKNRRPLDQLAEVQQEIRTAEQSFGGAGRVLVRFSGTEPLARVMVEGPSMEQVQLHAGRIADAIRAELGAAS
jgi:phosphoglucosamine mutase